MASCTDKRRSFLTVLRESDRQSVERVRIESAFGVLNEFRGWLFTDLDRFREDAWLNR